VPLGWEPRAVTGRALVPNVIIGERREDPIPILDLARKGGRKLENARLIVMRADIQTDVACVTEADQAKQPGRWLTVRR